MSRTSLKFPLKGALGLVGAVLLVAMFRRCEPWHMCYIPLLSGPESFVEFRHVLFTGHLRIPCEYFIVLSLVLLPAVACLFQGARDAVAALLKNKPALWAVSLSLVCFLISFFSGFFLDEKRYPAPLFVRSAALYLTLGLYGIVFFFIGVYRYSVDLKIWNRLAGFCFRLTAAVVSDGCFSDRVHFDQHCFFFCL